MTGPTFRFAPSPNGALHLGHAYSALINADMAAELEGVLLLRIEDIDTSRCTPDFEVGIYRDLEWLGLSWPSPVRRQSEHFADYEAALDRLVDAGLAYPSFLTRGEVRAMIVEAESDGIQWPRDPDGVPLHPEAERRLSDRQRRQRINDGEAYSWRLDMKAAVETVRGQLTWHEDGTGPHGETGTVPAHPASWGDVVIARKDVPTSYHLSVVVDDALQAISHVVRGRDLFHATAVHRLLQELLGLPVPTYLHHDLILSDDGRKLSKSQGDTALATLRGAGMLPADIRRMVGLGPSG